MNPKDELDIAIKCGYLLAPERIGSAGRKLWKAHEKKEENRNLNAKIIIFVVSTIISIIWGLTEGIEDRGDPKIYGIAIVIGVSISIPSLLAVDYFEKIIRKKLWTRLVKEREHNNNGSDQGGVINSESLRSST